MKEGVGEAPGACSKYWETVRWRGRIWLMVGAAGDGALGDVTEALLSSPWNIKL